MVTLLMLYDFMSEIAEKRILENLQTQNPNLDLHWTMPDKNALKILSECTHLENLQLSCNDEVLEEISWIKTLTKLRILNLRSGGVSILKDISPLADLQNLEDLNLGFQFVISDLSPLKNLTNLKKIDLHSLQISDISIISNLEKLEELDISFNQIRDIACLKNLKNLEKLRLSIEYLSYPPIWLVYLKTEDGKLGDYNHREELPEVEKIWQLMITKDEENINLAQQLAKGQGWEKEEFEMYRNLL